MVGHSRSGRVMCVAVAGLLLTAWPALAQRGAGGHRGGGGNVGAGSWGGNFAGRPGGFNRGAALGYDIQRDYYRNLFRRYDYGAFGYGYPGFYGGWDYPWWPGPYSGYPYGYNAPYLPYGGYGYPPQLPGPLPADYGAAYPTPIVSAAPILLNVAVPPDAEVWVDGHRTTQTGPMRRFSSPPMTPGKTYQYEVRARWKKDGRSVEQSRTVQVQPGQEMTVRLSQATASSTK